jgi:hypothetical protein
MDELERIAAAEGALSPEDLERFRGRMADKELRLALADFEEAIRAKVAALEDYKRVKGEFEAVSEEFMAVRKELEAVLVMLDRVEDRVRRAAEIATGEG